MPVVAIIVGLHFLGLVPAFRSGSFGWIAGAFCVIGGAALFLPAQLGEVALRQAVVGLGCAGVLWLAGLRFAATTLRQLGESRRALVS